MFFRNCRRVRQGDPLSPLLFDYVFEALASILDKARESGHIAGVVPHLIPGGVSHLQYANDIIIMIQLDDLAIANLKYILLCFESMSGLRINFHKSEVMMMGVEEMEGLRIAHMLNYKQGTFPFIYLGLPVSDRALSEGDWGPLTTKVGKRAEPWMRKLMSSAARLTIINACLSNLPLHAMAICLLGEGIHVTLDKHRSRFFLEANSTKRKYHWVRWSAMCNPKSLGGLGIVDMRLMNICLLVKWIWRLYDGEQGLWADIIRNKYLRDKDLLLDTHRTGSQLWIAIQKLKHLFKLGPNIWCRTGMRRVFGGIGGKGRGPLH
jgi:hypothetical protein